MPLKLMSRKTCIDKRPFFRRNEIKKITLWRASEKVHCVTLVHQLSKNDRSECLIIIRFRLQSHYIYLNQLNKSNDLMIPNGQGCIHIWI